MKYYQVKKEHDQKPKNPKIRNGEIYIGTELYTTTEFNKYKLNLEYMNIVEIPKNRIYIMFGARFSANDLK